MAHHIIIINIKQPKTYNDGSYFRWAQSTIAKVNEMRERDRERKKEIDIVIMPEVDYDHAGPI